MSAVAVLGTFPLFRLHALDPGPGQHDDMLAFSDNRGRWDRSILSLIIDDDLPIVLSDGVLGGEAVGPGIEDGVFEERELKGKVGDQCIRTSSLDPKCADDAFKVD